MRLADAMAHRHPRLAPAVLANLGGSIGRCRPLAADLDRKLRDASGWAPVYPSVREGFPGRAREPH